MKKQMRKPISILLSLVLVLTLAFSSVLPAIPPLADSCRRLTVDCRLRRAAQLMQCEQKRIRKISD